MIEITLQHAESLISLFSQREFQERAAHIALHHLERIDNRIAASIDGLLISGEEGMVTVTGLLEQADKGEMFAAALLAIESKNTNKIKSLLSLAKVNTATQDGLIGALDWTQQPPLGLLDWLGTQSDCFFQSTAIRGYAQHRIDPGTLLLNCIQKPDEKVQTVSLITAGKLGKQELMPLCENLTGHEDPAIRFAASYSATLLGSQNGLKPLGEFAIQPGPHQHKALNLLLKAVPLSTAHKFIQSLSKNPDNQRAVIKAVGITGDPFYIPWLIERMSDPVFKRLAGESFSFITGVDLAYQDLEQNPPEGFESGPNDDPDDSDVELDEDDDLPWPDVEKITHWWWQHSKQFESDTRYFMGRPVTSGHCFEVLKNGFQRQRIAAALYLCLLKPGSVLFPTSAPAWRQKEWLKNWPY